MSNQCSYITKVSIMQVTATTDEFEHMLHTVAWGSALHDSWILPALPSVAFAHSSLRATLVNSLGSCEAILAAHAAICDM